MTYLPPEPAPPPESRGGLPWTLRARDPSLPGLVTWIGDHHDRLDQALLDHGAVMLRGADAGSPERFEQLARALSPALQSDYLGTSPRDALTKVVHEASGLPGYYPIPAHCEMSFLAHPPDRLAFGCVVAPHRYGETPLVDMQAVATDVREDVAGPMRERGLRVVRNYCPPGQSGGPMQLKSWDAMFGTTDRDVVRARSAEEGLEPEFGADGSLRLISLQPPTKPHPVTGAAVWFNHLVVFHTSSGADEYRKIAALRPSLRTYALRAYASLIVERSARRIPSELRPMHVTYGDGGEIPDHHVAHVRDVIWSHMVAIPWERGDVIWIDNHRVAHGRLPYTGPRRIVVAWA